MTPIEPPADQMHSLHDEDTSASSERSILVTAQVLWDEARASLGDFMQLAALEVRQAGMSFSIILVNAVIMALLLVSAWFGAMAALAIFLARIGLDWSLAILAVVALNLALAWVLKAWSQRLSQDLLFRATRRQIAGVPASSPGVAQ